MYGAVPTANCKEFIITSFALERCVSWMNLKQKMEALAHDVRCAIHGVAPEAAEGERSSSSVAAESAAMLSVGAPPDPKQAKCQQSPSRRSERIRSWRRRALERKGAQLYSAIRANSQTGSLAMLDEDGVVIAWYGRAESGASADDRVVDAHMSQFYVAEDRALGVPGRDLCSATIHGRSTQTGWRRFPRGATCWANTVIEPIWLRDGRLQGFSHVTRRLSDTPLNMGVEKPKLTLNLQSLRAHAVAHSSAVLVALALMVVGDFALAQGSCWLHKSPRSEQT